MSQQLGIVMVIDSMAALEEGTLENNIYMFDNMGALSTGQGTDRLVQYVDGAYYRDGSQAGDYVYNWAAVGLSSLPESLPRSFKFGQVASAKEEKLQDLKSKVSEIEEAAEITKNELEKVSTGLIDLIGLSAVLTEDESEGGIEKVQINAGPLPHPGEVEAQQVFYSHDGEVIPHSQRQTALEEGMISQPIPMITNISGEAVDKGIIYPAQYGSPDYIYDGWYWSATVATHLPGTWSYILHITIYEMSFQSTGKYDSRGQKEKSPRIIWTPHEFRLEAKLVVKQQPVTNGFTGAGDGWLPVVHTLLAP